MTSCSFSWVSYGPVALCIYDTCVSKIKSAQQWTHFISLILELRLLQHFASIDRYYFILMVYCIVALHWSHLCRVNICTGWAIEKTWHFIYVYIFANYWPIFKIFLLAHSAENLQWCAYYIPHPSTPQMRLYTTLWNINEICVYNHNNKQTFW